VSSTEAQWHKVLVTGHRPLVISRRLWRYVPSAPRCKVCGNPFAGIGGRIARVAGYAPSRKNPNLCGELVVAADVHEDLDSLLPNPDRRTIQLRGRQAPTSVLVAGPC
jgi:hypothetical protein